MSSSPPRHGRCRSLLAATAAVVLVTSCGGDDSATDLIGDTTGAPDPATTTPSTTTPSTSTAAASTAATAATIVDTGPTAAPGATGLDALLIRADEPGPTFTATELTRQPVYCGQPIVRLPVDQREVQLVDATARQSVIQFVDVHTDADTAAAALAERTAIFAECDWGSQVPESDRSVETVSNVVDTPELVAGVRGCDESAIGAVLTTSSDDGPPLRIERRVTFARCGQLVTLIQFDAVDTAPIDDLAWPGPAVNAALTRLGAAAS